MPSHDVEFVINCFERNIEQVTSPGFLAAAIAQHRYPFTTRTLLINNVDDQGAAQTLAQACVDRGEIDRFIFVADLLPRALRASGLRVRDFGPYLHWSDCCLVALTMSGAEWLCYVDVDLQLSLPHDWVTDAIGLITEQPDVAVGNPNWVLAGGYTTVATEADRAGDGHYIGYGFTDQVFLIRRAQFSHKLRRRWLPLWLDCPATLRWTGAAEGLFFEQIIDGYMRRKRLMRVTILATSFEPIPMSEYPVVSVGARLRRRRGAIILAALAVARRRVPSLVTNPRLRTVGLLDLGRATTALPGTPTRGSTARD